MYIPYLLVGPRGIQYLLLSFGEKAHKGLKAKLPGYVGQSQGSPAQPWPWLHCHFLRPSLHPFLQGHELRIHCFPCSHPEWHGLGRASFLRPRAERHLEFSQPALLVLRKWIKSQSRVGTPMESLRKSVTELGWELRPLACQPMALP